MATRKPTPTVALLHPSGRFTVNVTPERAAVLEARGYTPQAAAKKAASKAEKES
jgi:hypothetical protein